MKVGDKYSMVLFAVFMSLGMTFSMSVTLTLVNAAGSSDLLADFLSRWPRAFLVGFAVSLPTSIVLAPLARKATNRLTTR